MDLLWIREGRSHDLVFKNGDCPVTTDRVDSITQKLYIRLRTFKGEWFLAEGYGVPWLENILGHKVKKTTVDMVIINTIMNVDGVKKLISFDSSFDNPRREYECRFVVQVDSGRMTNVITI